MFKRILVEEWMLMVPIVAFVIFAGVFAAVTWRALRISKSEREHLAALPLDENSPNSHSR
jgi:hypothetical protein